jgi:hypothetical protein
MPLDGSSFGKRNGHDDEHKHYIIVKKTDEGKIDCVLVDIDFPSIGEDCDITEAILWSEFVGEAMVFHEAEDAAMVCVIILRLLDDDELRSRIAVFYRSIK